MLFLDGFVATLIFICLFFFCWFAVVCWCPCFCSHLRSFGLTNSRSISYDGLLCSLGDCDYLNQTFPLMTYFYDARCFESSTGVWEDTVLYFVRLPRFSCWKQRLKQRGECFHVVWHGQRNSRRDLCHSGHWTFCFPM